MKSLSIFFFLQQFEKMASESLLAPEKVMYLNFMSYKNYLWKTIAI